MDNTVNWLCRIWLHQWSKWELCKLKPLNSDIPLEGQHRRCVKCGIYQKRALHFFASNVFWDHHV